MLLSMIVSLAWGDDPEPQPPENETPAEAEIDDEIAWLLQQEEK